MMRFEWDEAKNRGNIEKHGISFNQAASIFDYPVLSVLDTRFDYGEDRYIAIGLLMDIVPLTVVYTERGEQTIRIISARKSNKLERERYEQAIQ